jgi:hypothetical protein
VSVNRASFCNILFLAVATAAQDEMLIKCKIILWPLSDHRSRNRVHHNKLVYLLDSTLCYKVALKNYNLVTNIPVYCFPRFMDRPGVILSARPREIADTRACV